MSALPLSLSLSIIVVIVVVIIFIVVAQAVRVAIVVGAGNDNRRWVAWIEETQWPSAVNSAGPAAGFKKSLYVAAKAALSETQSLNWHSEGAGT